MRERYKHSGRVPPLGLVLGLGLGLVAAVPASFLYDYGIIHIPYVKLRAVLTILFGAAAGAAAGWGMLLGKVRNNRVAGSVGVVAALMALYVSWATWLILIFEKPWGWLPGLLARPVAVWRLVRLVNVDGTWAMSDSPATKGTQLWIIWAIEALTIAGFGLLAASAMIKSRTFCEKCDHWCHKAGQLLIVAAMQPADLLTRLNQGGLDFLANATPATLKEPRYSLTWYSCGSCGGLHTLTVKLFQVKKTKKKTTEKAKEIASHLVLSMAEVDLLRNFQGKTHSVMATAASR